MMIRAFWALAFLIAGSPSLLFAQSQSIFNGKDLSGWRVHGTEKWYVENGELVCESGPDTEYGYLATEKTFKNFELSVDFKQEADGNSGIFFRSSLDGTIISGWQVEVAPPGHDSGGVYESYGRGWLVKPDSIKDAALKMGEWNTMRIRVVGDRIQTWLNDVPMISLVDDKIGEANGSIALQIHDGGGIKVRWRNLFIEEIEPDVNTGDYLYNTRLIRATPGELAELIELLKARSVYHQASGDEPPFMMRHSQGDQWDLLLIYPIGDYATYYSPARIAQRARAASKIGHPDDLLPFIAWQEETFFHGPPLDVMQSRMEGAGFFHVEMFTALPDRREELLEQRKMENVYLAELARPQNAIFTRSQGGAWDYYTLGFYRDIKHFAESADIPAEEEEAAALAAGFEGANKIGTYLRSLIAYHHDTLATAVR